MKRLTSILSVFLLICAFTYAENPLKGYVDEENFREGEKIFQESTVEIFTEPASLSDSEARLRKRFPEVVSVARTNGSWNGTFYFVKGEGKTVRKTIRGSGVVRGSEDSFAVTVFNEGIRVRDVLSGITAEIKTKRR